PASRTRGSSPNTPVTRPATESRGSAPRRMPSVLAVPGTGFPPVAAMPICGWRTSTAWATRRQKIRAAGSGAARSHRLASAASCAAASPAHSAGSTSAASAVRINRLMLPPLPLAATVPGSPHLSGDPRGLAGLAEPIHERVRLLGRNDQDHPDAHVEGPEHLVLRDPAVAHDRVELGRDLPARAVDLRLEPFGHDPRQVLRESAARDVCERVDPALEDERVDRGQVAPVHTEQNLADRYVEIRERIVDPESEPVEEYASEERIAVRVEPVRGEPDERIALPDAVLARALVLLDDAHDEAGQVVVARRVEVRHLRRLAAEERAPVLAAPLRDAGHDRLRNARLETAHPDVVEEEERPRALDEDVVHAVVDQIAPDRVVLAGEDCDFQLRPDAVRARDEHRPLVPRGDPEQPAERARLGEDARHVRRTDELADPVLRPRRGLPVHAGVPITQPSTHTHLLFLVTRARAPASGARTPSSPGTRRPAPRSPRASARRADRRRTARPRTSPSRSRRPSRAAARPPSPRRPSRGAPGSRRRTRRPRPSDRRSTRAGSRA